MDGKVVIGAELETKSFDRQIEALKDKLDDLESQKLYFEAKGMTGELKDVEREIEVTKNKMIGLQTQKAKLEEKSSMGLSDVLKQSSSQLEGIINKVGRWALAVFSVRTAYNLVRQASSTLSQYNEQYATNLEYIRYALAQALAPVLEYIVNLAMKLMAIVNTILSGWFGINIFSKASAKNFANAKKSLGGANKSAKELQKTLAGFDEMNILNSMSTGGGGGIGGVLTPSFDLAGDYEVPKWIKWIADNGELVMGILTGIGLAIASLKLAKFLKDVLGLNTGFGKVYSGMLLILSGITLMVKNIAILVTQWNELTNAEKVMRVALVALGGAFTALGVAIAFGTGGLSLIIPGIIAVVSAITALVAHIVDENSETKKLLKTEQELKEVREELKNATNDYVNAVDRAEEAQKALEEAERKNKMSGEELNKQVEQGILDYKEMNEKQREVYKAYLENKDAQDNLAQSTQNLNDKTFEEKELVAETSGNYEEYKNKVIEAYENGQISAEQARTYIEKAMAGMDEASRKTFQENLPNDIANGLNPDRYSSFADKFKNWWNNTFIGGLLRDIQLKINGNFSMNYSSSGAGGGSGGGRASGAVMLATGAILNQPRKRSAIRNSRRERKRTALFH